VSEASDSPIVLVALVAAEVVVPVAIVAAMSGGTGALLAAAAVAAVAVVATTTWWTQRAVREALAPVAAVVTPEGEAPAKTPRAVGDAVRKALAANASASTALAAEHSRFEAVLETMAPAVIVLDARRRIEIANRSARTSFGLRDDCENTPLAEAIRSPEVHELVDAIAKAPSAESEAEISMLQRRLRVRGSRLNGGSLVLVADDLTEIRRLERVRRDFVANVSHELRTPVAVIRANAETLLDGGLDSRSIAEPLVGGLVRHAERLARLVGELLDISALEAGQRVFSREEVLVIDLVEEVIAALAPAATQRSTTVVHVVPEDEWIVADPKAVEQILMNFVENAIKYGREAGRVEVGLRVVDGQTRIEVADDGPGIESQHIRRIFERFYRVDAGRSRESGGTGLGLAIAKHLAEGCGGAVGVDPRRPHGSVFWLALPRAAPDAAADA
jgi:two-component system phosphate regulon sensor histidine kinase PhoR